MSEIMPIKPINFVCPTCKRPLRSGENALQCSECHLTYPIVGGIPDFLSENELASVAPNYREIKRLEFLAPIYEGRLWQSFILNLAGGYSSSLQSIANFIAETLAGVTGVVLDVACGPATYGRRMASPQRSVYGIDFSMGTLQQGMKNIARDGISNIHLARTRVEELPFEGAVFDGAICSGSLHLFPDTVRALQEVARTLKAGAPLSVQTFVPKSLKDSRGGLSYTQPELQHYVAEAGFEAFQYSLAGTSITFSVKKTLQGA